MTSNELANPHHFSRVVLERACRSAVKWRAARQACVVERFRRSELPLCKRYFYVAFGTLPIQTEQGAERSKVLVWARGYVADGGSELLGFWLMEESGAREWRELGEDLRRRGLVEIVFALTDAFGFSRCDLAAMYDGAVAIPWSARLRRGSAERPQHESSGLTAVLDVFTVAETARNAVADVDALQQGGLGSAHRDLAETCRAPLKELEPFYQPPSRFRHLIWTGEAEAELLHQKLVRSVGRHGAFAGDNAALTFVGRVLERAQRGFDARGRLLGSFVARPPPGVSKVQRTRRQQPFVQTLPDD